MFPSVADVYLPISEASTSTRIAVSKEEQAEAAFALEDMGAGTTHLATIISMVWSTPAGGACLVEEPEQGLHSSAQRELALWLRIHASSAGKQIIVATHSPIFARPSESTSVHLALYSPDSGATFKKLTFEDAPLVNESLGARLIDYYAFDVLLYVEGQSEEVAVPILAKALGIDLADLGIRLVPLGGDAATRLQRLTEYLEYMKEGQVFPYVILDSDPGVPKAVDDLVHKGLLSPGLFHLWKRDKRGGEFEDNFTDEQLVAAANEVASLAESESKPLGLANLSTLRSKKPRVKTSKLLQEAYYSRHKYSLSKIDLALQLSILAANDVEAGNRDYQFVDVLEAVRDLALTRRVEGDID